jgi:hypothetical protein
MLGSALQKVVKTNHPVPLRVLGSAMQKIESSIIAVVIGLAFPFIITFLISGGNAASFQIPCPNPTNGVCTVGSVGGNNVTLPSVLVSTANLVITLLVGILMTFAVIMGIWGAIEYLGARGGSGRGGV